MRVNTGADWQAAQMGGTPGTAAKYIGLTANAGAPAAGDTALTGEIGSGTLIRASATYAHTTSATSYTLTKTFTSDQTVLIHKIGVFDAVTTGTLVFETALSADASLVSGDTLAITETVNI